MKISLLILLAFLILFQPFSRILIYVSFKINQERIAKTICVQKEIKNNCCKGKCYLEKLLNETDNKKQLSELLKCKSEIIYCNSFVKNSQFKNQIEIPINKQIGYYIAYWSSSYVRNIFRPPKLI